MAKKKTAKKEAAIYEDPDVLVDKYEKLQENLKENKNKIAIVGGVVLLGIAALFYFNYSNKEASAKANNEVYTAQYYFAMDSLDVALNGKGAVKGFKKVSSKYDGTDAGNLSNFYQGVIHMKKGNYQAAVKALKEFDADDILVQARAYALLGDAYVELGKYDEAKNAYDNAIAHEPNKFITPDYLLKKATLFYTQKKYSDAVLVYGELLEKYPKHRRAVEAKKYMALCKGMASSN